MQIPEEEHRSVSARTASAVGPRLTRGSRIPRLASFWIAAVVAGSCSDAIGPVAPGDLVIVGGGEMTSIAAVSVSRGRVIARIGPIPEFKDSYGLSPDSTRLFISSFDNSTPVTLTVVDTRSLRVVAQEPMSAIAARSTVGPVIPTGSYALAVSPDGQKLLMNGWLNGNECIVVIDVASLTPVGVFGPFLLAKGGVVPLPANRNSATQRIMLFGVRPSDSTRTVPPILILGGPNLDLVDSLQLGTSVGQAVFYGAGNEAIVMNGSSVYHLDLATRQLVASAVRLAPGRPCASNDGQRLYLTDPGNTLDTPGSGEIQVYDQGLQVLAPIDLRARSTPVPTLNYCAVTRDGKYLVVSSGTGSIGPLFGPQPGRLFVIDRQTNGLVRSINIGDWASFEVFAF